MKELQNLTKIFLGKGIKISTKTAEIIEGIRKFNKASKIRQICIQKHRKLTKDKSFGKKDNFELISPKKESEILEKFEDQDQDSKNSEKEFEGLDSTDGLVDTFKIVLDSIEEELE